MTTKEHLNLETWILNQDCVTSEEWHRAGLPVPTPREVESIGALELARFLRDKREVS